MVKVYVTPNNFTALPTTNLPAPLLFPKNPHKDGRNQFLPE